uniref:Sm domain-containing protein n=1 Tax=Glossina palpalis gambiensis TaxID=67801 RepID=A0A1B0BED3_9MUSC
MPSVRKQTVASNSFLSSIFKIDSSNQENALVASSDQSKSQEDETKREEEITDQSSSPADSQELDISSDLSNPLGALYAKDYPITDKNPKIIDQNFAAFESALTKVCIYDLDNLSNKDALPSTSKAGAEEAPLRRIQNYQLPAKSQPQMKKERNLFTQTTQSRGPLSELNKYISNKSKVRVIVCKEEGIRGYVVGFLQFFDCHWNLLLTDVEECYKHRKFKYADQKLPLLKAPEDCSRRIRELGLTLPLQNAKSLNRKTIEIKRHIPQLLVRGEHVVLVQLDNEQPQ